MNEESKKMEEGRSEEIKPAEANAEAANPDMDKKAKFWAGVKKFAKKAVKGLFLGVFTIGAIALGYIFGSKNAPAADTVEPSEEPQGLESSEPPTSEAPAQPVGE